MDDTVCVLKNHKEKLRRWILSYYFPQGVIIAHFNYNADINCAEARYSNLQARCVLGIWGSKLSADSLSRSLIDPPVYDPRLALNSARCFETILHARPSCIFARDRDESEILFRILFPILLPEIYQGSFWYAGSPRAWQIFTLFDSVHNLHFPG